MIQELNNARSILLRQRANKAESLSGNSWTGICVPLEAVPFNDCGCINRPDCKVLRSKFELPEVIKAVEGELINVRYRNEILASFSPYEVKTNQYHRALKDRVGYWIETTQSAGRRLYIWNTLNLTSIPVFGVWTSFEALMELQTCCDSCGDFDCEFDWKTVNYPIDSDLISTMYEIAIAAILNSKQLNDDKINNAADETY